MYEYIDVLLDGTLVLHINVLAGDVRNPGLASRVL
jgi:hypothetical protein